MAKRGAKSIFEKRKKLIAALKAIRGTEGYAQPSRYHKIQMAERGLIRLEPAETGLRGRPALVAQITRLGQSYINFEKKNTKNG
jgi:hypothetical protein